MRRLKAVVSAMASVSACRQMVAAASAEDRCPVICAVARTPFGRYRGALRGYSSVELGAFAAAEALRRAGVDPSSGLVDEVIFGQVLQAGVGQSPARQVALAAGLPVSTPCTTVNKVCGSSLKTVMLAASAIRAGEYELVLAGGMESMTNAPSFIPAGAPPDTKPSSTLFDDGLKDPWSGEMMGETGETCSQTHNISREAADSFAAQSHALATAAWDSGVMSWECFPVPGLNKGGDPITLERDEGIRTGASEAILSQMNPSFLEGGCVTAGNASQLSDGGAAVLVASAAAARKHGWPVLALVLDQTTSALAPRDVMSAPIPAVARLLERNQVRADIIGPARINM